MALSKEDAKSGSLRDILETEMKNLGVGKQAAPQPTEQPIVPEPKQAAAPVAEPAPKTEPVIEAPVTERSFEWTAKDGTVKTVKIPTDATLESLARKAREQEDGMRQFQRERDELLKRYGKETDDIVNRYKSLEKTFKSQGIEGIIDMMAGKEGAAAEYRKSISDRAIRRLDANEAEIARMDSEELILAERRMREAKELELKEIHEEKDRAMSAANDTLLRSRLETAYNKVRLDGKFNDSDFEEYHNQIIWDKVLGSLDKIATEKGIEPHQLTPQLIHAETKRIADLHTRGLNRKAEESAAQKIDEQKEAALNTARTLATKGVAGNKESVEDLVDHYMSQGNGMGAFSSIFKKLYSK